MQCEDVTRLLTSSLLNNGLSYASAYVYPIYTGLVFTLPRKVERVAAPTTDDC